MDYLVKLEEFAYAIANNQRDISDDAERSARFAACLFHTDRVIREAIASGAVKPVETTMGYAVDLTNPDASLKLSELVAYGKTNGIWWGDDVPTLAKSLGFDVDPQALPTAPPRIEVAPPVADNAQPEGQAATVGDWVEMARNRGREIVKVQRGRDLYPSQESIGDTIAEEFRKAGTVGTDGKPLTGATIKRHALKGISSAVGKRLSTTIRQGK